MAQKRLRKRLRPDEARQVAVWLIEGHSPADVLEAFAVEFPKVDPAGALEAGFRHIADLVDELGEHSLAWHLAARRELYRRALEIADFRTCYQILRELAELEGHKAKPGNRTPATADHQADDGIPTADDAGDTPTIH
jgi:hypothetical protein